MKGRQLYTALSSCTFFFLIWTMRIQFSMVGITHNKSLEAVVDVHSNFAENLDQDGFQSVCLTSECFNRYVKDMVRAFPDYSKELWCVHKNETSFDKEGRWHGLLLVKVPKAASSTAAGLALRIANRSNCAVQYEHREGGSYANRSLTKSFLLTSVRDPAARALSAVWFFMVTPLNITPTDSNIIRSLHTSRGGKTKGKGGYQFKYASFAPIEPRSVWSPYHPEQVRNLNHVRTKVKELIFSYDFIIVVERMDESLTAFALLTGLDLADVLVTSSKVAGSYIRIRHGPNQGKCNRQLKAQVSPGLQIYLDSMEWRAMNAADYLLYHAANRSLDKTIERLGKLRFEEGLREFRRLKSLVQDKCGPRLGFGCTPDGVPVEGEECYIRDFGCGYRCVDTTLLSTDVFIQ